MLLPLGSVVRLKNGEAKMLIINRGVKIRINNQDCYFQYEACVDPVGASQENIFYFNEEEIDQVIFKGYVDKEDEENFEIAYQKWMKANNIDKFTSVNKLLQKEKQKLKAKNDIESKLFNNRG